MMNCRTRKMSAIKERTRTLKVCLLPLTYASFFSIAKYATAPGNRVPGGDTGRTKLPNPRAPSVLSDAE